MSRVRGGIDFSRLNLTPKVAPRAAKIPPMLFLCVCSYTHEIQEITQEKTFPVYSYTVIFKVFVIVPFRT